MESSNKNTTKSTTQNTSSYNPLNLIFSTRKRTESENSVNSVSSTSSSQSCQSGTHFGGLQRQSSKNEEYLWMIHFQAPTSVSARQRRGRCYHYSHSKTTRRCANMAAKLHSLRLLSALLIAVVADPAPGRVPKVYNALITSNQNLEPSKAYPVYQPVLHDAVFTYQPSVLYGGNFPFGNGIIPIPAQPPNGVEPSSPAPQPEASTENAATEAPTAVDPAAPVEPSDQPAEPPAENPEANSGSTAAPPLPPNTESPIPLNEYGLPAQLLPLGRFDPAYNGFTQLAPFSFSYPSYQPYPGVRLYDPFDPFSLGPHGIPLYRPLPHVLGPSLPLPFSPARIPVPVPAPAATPAPAQSSQTPPPEPNDLNLLNYNSKDPAIPNVPPPPLPNGGLKSDTAE